MDDDRCAVGVGWCARADAMFDAEGLHVIDVHRGDDGLEITVETDPEPVGCPVCGVVVVGHGRRVVRAADAPCFGLSVRVLCASGCGAAPSRRARRGRGRRSIR